MRSSIRNSMAVTLAVVFACTFVLAPSPASAKWHSQSPSSSASGISDILMYGALACAGAAIVYAIAKHNSKPSEETANATVKQVTTESGSANKLTGPRQAPAKTNQTADSTTIVPVVPEKDSRLNFYLGLTNDRAMSLSDKPTMAFSDLTLRAGVTIGF